MILLRSFHYISNNIFLYEFIHQKSIDVWKFHFISKFIFVLRMTSGRGSESTGGKCRFIFLFFSFWGGAIIINQKPVLKKFLLWRRVRVERRGGRGGWTGSRFLRGFRYMNRKTRSLLCLRQSWALPVFFNFFNNKKWFFCTFYKVDSLFLHQFYVKSQLSVKLTWLMQKIIFN